jgi:hypothetical protein
MTLVTRFSAFSIISISAMAVNTSQHVCCNDTMAMKSNAKHRQDRSIFNTFIGFKLPANEEIFVTKTIF